MQRKTRKQKTKLKWIFIILYSLAVGLSVSIGLLDLWSQTETKRSDRASSAAYPKQREETGQTNEHERERTNEESGPKCTQRECEREQFHERETKRERNVACATSGIGMKSQCESETKWEFIHKRNCWAACESVCVFVCAVCLRACVCGTEMAITACRQQQQQHNSNYLVKQQSNKLFV